MKHIPFILIYYWSFFIISACSNSHSNTIEKSMEYPKIFPDYTFVTIPANIAPLNFRVEKANNIKVEFTTLNGTPLLTVSGGKRLNIPEKKWKQLMNNQIGNTLCVTVSIWSPQYPQGIIYKPFEINISNDLIDPYIVYRLIDPGYEPWNHMGIYQRELSSFKEKTIVDNHKNTLKCFNCHSSCKNSSDMFLFHERGKEGGTIIVKNGIVQKIDLSKMGKHQHGVYPAWHPNGRWILFSSNMTLQSFYNRGKKAIEVYDSSSDLLLYDSEKQQVLTDTRFNQSNNWETFPTWSPDGKTLYFCSAIPEENIPVKCTNVKYAILCVNFSADDGTFGQQIDTLYNPKKRHGSASHPRVSADGRYLLYSEAAYGTFPIWHSEADLKIIDLKENKELNTNILNSPEAESFHSWSSNGRWILFTSRRMDGRHTRLYIAHFSKNGQIGKPFLLPQKNPEDNWTRIQSYNVPDFVKGEIKFKYNY